MDANALLSEYVARRISYQTLKEAVSKVRDLRRELKGIWTNMKRRCYRKEDPQYQRYGARGIGMCQRWFASFEDFLEDVWHRPGPEYSLDRIGNDGNYEPSNVRWATDAEQRRNKRSNVWVTVNGVRKVLKDHCVDFGIDPNTAKHRLSKGWTPEDVFSKPTGDAWNAEYVALDGVSKKFVDHCRDHGIDIETARDRRKNGWSLEEAIKTPADTRHGRRRMIKIDGVTKPLSVWAREYGLSWSTVTSRLGRGFSILDALQTPANERYGKLRMITFNGKTQTIADWVRELGIPRSALVKRLNSGWPLEKAFQK